MPVHLAGRPIDLDRLYKIASTHNLRVIEDAAQAIGSRLGGRRIGSFGDLVCFSFQATKNITTGEGGCLVLNNSDEALLAEKLRLHGITRSGHDTMEVDILGGKSNMTDIAAAIGICQLPNADSFASTRRALANHYFDTFGLHFEAEFDTQLPIRDVNLVEPNWHLFQIILPDWIKRYDFQELMNAKYHIGTGCHYPAIHLFQLYQQRGFKNGMFPVAELVGSRIVSLPIHITMTFEDVERTVAAVKDILSKQSFSARNSTD